VAIARRVDWCKRGEVQTENASTLWCLPFFGANGRKSEVDKY
jgi:hypothetical protein